MSERSNQADSEANPQRMCKGHSVCRMCICYIHYEASSGYSASISALTMSRRYSSVLKCFDKGFIPETICLSTITYSSIGELCVCGTHS